MSTLSTYTNSDTVPTSSAHDDATISSPHAALAVLELSKRFGNRHALSNITFTLPQGAFLAVFGANGAGKTTLLRVLSTLLRPDAGSVRLCGIDVREQPEQARGTIGLISHNSMLYPDLTAEENLLFAARLYGVANPHERALEMLAAVELNHRRMDRVRGFSHGMTKRLAIARALIHDPELVLMDEPYSGLDARAMRVFDSLINQARQNRTFVMVSHDLEQGFELATHILLLAQGQVMAFGEKDRFALADFTQSYLQTAAVEMV